MWFRISSDCVSSAMDLVFVVDGSGSICDNDPKFVYGKDVTCDNWNFVLKFMGDFVKDMDIGLTSTRVGLVTFATKPTLGWDLRKYETYFYYFCLKQLQLIIILVINKCGSSSGSALNLEIKEIQCLSDHCRSPSYSCYQPVEFCFQTPYELIYKFVHRTAHEKQLGLTVVLFSMFRYTTKAELVDAIHNLPYPGGETDTAGGLRMMRTQVFNVEGDRPFANNTCIIITDGLPTVPSAVPPEISAVHAQGITTYAIGVTLQVNEDTLKLLSSSPNQVQDSTCAL